MVRKRILYALAGVAGLGALYYLARRPRAGAIGGIKVTGEGSNRTVTATVENTGNVKLEFGIGCSVGHTPAGGTGCELGPSLDHPSEDLAVQAKTIAPGKRVTVDWTFDDAILEGGTNMAIVKVWKGTTTTPENCLDGDYEEFTVTKIVTAEIVSISVS